MMGEKRFIGYDNGEYENRNYAVYDLSKSEKTKEDFWDNENDCYDIWAFMDYLEENNCILSCDKVVELLNEQQATINELKERNAHNFAKKMQLMKEIKELKAKLREKEEDEKLYANEIVELRKTNEEWLQFKELGGDY